MRLRRRVMREHGWSHEDPALVRTTKISIAIDKDQLRLARKPADSEGLSLVAAGVVDALLMTAASLFPNVGLERV